MFNWKDLSPHIEVNYSYFDVNQKYDGLDTDIAYIHLPNGISTDIEWNDEKKSFLVSLFSDSYHNLIERIEIQDPEEVIRFIKNKL